jgi:hypothetical protein
MTYETPIRLKNPRDLLSIVPYALGYRPVESLVVVCIRSSGTLGMIARSSLKDLVDATSCLEIAKLVAKNAHDDDASHIFLVLYTNASDEFTLRRISKYTSTFASELAPVYCETWVVDADRYYPLGCEQQCCPANGLDVAELESTIPSAALVFKGYAPAATRDDYISLPEITQDAVAAAARAEHRISMAMSDAGQTAQIRKQAYGTWRYASKLVRKGESVSSSSLGKLAGALQDVVLRDAILVSCLPGGYRAVQALLNNSGNADEVVGRLLGSVIVEESTLTFDPEKHSVARSLLEQVASHASMPAKAAPLTLLAFLAWWGGDGTLTNHRLAEALELDPDYTLATTLNAAVLGGVRPGWIRAHKSASSAA